MDLEKEDGQYFKDGVGFNFCDYLPDSEYFASYSNLDGTGLQILTSSEPIPDSRTLVRNEENKIGGIELTWVSDEACVGGATNSTNSFTAKVLCDEKNMMDGEAEILAVDVSDKCNPIVTLQHDSGCPIFMDSRGRYLKSLRLLIPILGLLLLIGLCVCMCCCLKRRSARKDRKEKELREGNTHMPIEA